MQLERKDDALRLVGLLCLLMFVPSTIAVPPVTDQAIVTAVETFLSVDSYVPAHAIDVTAAEGVVTLSGRVDNLLAKERAVHVTQSIKGVRAVIDHIMVMPVSRSDADIKADVEQALVDDPAVNRYDLRLTVSNSVVTLTGQVGSHAEQQLVPALVKAVRGVKAIANEIEFSYATVVPRTDRDVAADVRRRLEMDIWVYDKLIDVVVSNGVVRLTGQVKSASDKRRAVADAWVAGTRNVDDSGLKVVTWLGPRPQRASSHAIKSDAALVADVRLALLYDPRVGATHINVDARDGVVTLHGIVDNLATKRAAAADARNTVGVWNVRNLLKVRPATLPADEDLKKTIAAAYRRNPYLESSPVKISVRHGIVTLSGVVDSIAERSQAEAVASRIQGVVAVRNFMVPMPASEWLLHNSANIIEDNLPPPIVVMPSENQDRQIQYAVEYQLSWSPFVDADQVRVVVVDGVVTLTGTVESSMESGAAEDSAYKAGARKVVNNVKVRR